METATVPIGYEANLDVVAKRKISYPCRASNPGCHYTIIGLSPLPNYFRIKIIMICIPKIVPRSIPAPAIFIAVKYWPLSLLYKRKWAVRWTNGIKKDARSFPIMHHAFMLSNRSHKNTTIFY